jgi:hypothetical protein
MPPLRVRRIHDVERWDKDPELFIRAVSFVPGCISDNGVHTVEVNDSNSWLHYSQIAVNNINTEQPGLE